MKNEAYWNGKYLKIDQVYGGRPLPQAASRSWWKPAPKATTCILDVRRFIWADDCILQKVVRESILGGIIVNDELAWRCQRWVCRNMTYVGDDAIGCPEYWLFPAESLQMRRGDCEDGAILMASLMLNAGVDPWRVRVSASDVVGGGHAYVTYCRETDNEFVVLDWCYEADQQIAPKDKPLLRDKASYYGGDRTWFSWNHLHAWGHAPTALGKRVRGGGA